MVSTLDQDTIYTGKTFALRLLKSFSVNFDIVS
jgi:hypothetical protein